ncbi:hypothetical protein, partial [Ruminiclostridium cellobioparum]|uniref:hypothetical protein n=1 Tax=Ruminiclostridium cellobioparum TaxID=29355 RepID=UPI0028AE8506
MKMTYIQMAQKESIHVVYSPSVKFVLFPILKSAAGLPLTPWNCVINAGIACYRLWNSHIYKKITAHLIN